MNKRLQGFCLGVLCCATFAGVTAVAKTVTETIQATYKDIKIYVDGVKIDPKDGNGESVEPFIYNGTTYLPVRAVGEAVGKTVSWDGATSSVYLGEKPGDTQYMLDVCPPYEKGGYTEYVNGNGFQMSGMKYSNGFSMGDSWEESYAIFNLNGQYTSMTFEMGHIDGSGDADKTVMFYLDGKAVEEYLVEYQGLSKKVTIPLNNALQLKITRSDGYTQTGFGNVTIK